MDSGVSPEAPVDRDVIRYGETFTKFIEATYQPVRRAFEVIGV
jgi:hypothetical protein